MKNTFYTRFGKRIFDLALGGLLLPFLIPFIILISIFVKIQMGPPVFFRQIRPGLKGKPFHILKFRSMKNLFDEFGNPLSDEKRLTSFGKFLRKTSFDEFPEIFNVIVGEMSFVGPRPLLMKYLPLYSQEQMRRHNVLPGITGLAQISGRNSLCWKDKFIYDLYYVDNISFGLDLKIIFLTISEGFKQNNICQPGSATCEEFKGNECK